MKKVLNVFGIIFAAILSLILIPTLIMAPVWQGVSGLLEPDFIQSVTAEIIEEIDLSDISLSSPDSGLQFIQPSISHDVLCV